MTVVLLTLAATFCMQLGLFWWKLSADAKPPLHEQTLWRNLYSFATDWKWLAGFAATVVGWLLFIRATHLGEISLVQPLMSVGDIFLVLLAVVFLKERLRPLEWLGLAMIVGGAGALSMEARVAPVVEVDALRAALFFVPTVLAWVACVMWMRARRHAVLPSALAVGFGFGVGAVLTKLMTLHFATSGSPFILPAALWNPYLPLVVLSNMLGIAWLQVAFQRGRAAIVVPVQLSMVNVLAVLGGWVVLQEQLSAWRMLSIGVMFMGTALLHRHEPPAPAAGRSAAT